MNTVVGTLLLVQVWSVAPTPSTVGDTVVLEREIEVADPTAGLRLTPIEGSSLVDGGWVLVAWHWDMFSYFVLQMSHFGISPLRAIGQRISAFKLEYPFRLSCKLKRLTRSHIQAVLRDRARIGVANVFA